MPQTFCLKKPVIHVITEEKAAMLKYEAKANRDKISPNIDIISHTYLDEVRKTDKYILPSRVDIGDTITLHPFVPNQYVLIQDLEDATFDALYSCMSGIARCLGATEMQWIKTTDYQGERTFDLDGNISYKLFAEANLHIKNQEGNHNKFQETKTTKFSENEVISLDEKIEDYKEASNIVKKFGLQHHIDITELIEGRNPQKKHKITSKEVTINIMSNINQSFDAAFSLNYMSGVFKINASVQKVLRECRNVELRYVINFL